MPTVVLVFFVALFAGVTTLYLPDIDARQAIATADKRAVNMFAYKAALIGYLNSNPGFSGVIPDASLNLPIGMVRDANWTNVVANNTLYVFEAVPSNQTGLLDLIYLKTEKSLLVGKNRSGTYMNAKGYASGPMPVTVPAIPNGSIVIIGM